MGDIYIGPMVIVDAKLGKKTTKQCTNRECDVKYLNTEFCPKCGTKSFTIDEDKWEDDFYDFFVEHFQNYDEYSKQYSPEFYYVPQVDIAPPKIYIISNYTKDNKKIYGIDIELLGEGCPIEIKPETIDMSVFSAECSDPYWYKLIEALKKEGRNYQVQFGVLEQC